jgi:hypothetical protein
MRKIGIAWLGGLVAMLAIAVPSAGAQSVGGCQLDGTAQFSPGLSSSSQPFTYSFGGTLEGCQSSESGAPASGAVSAGQTITEQVTNSITGATDGHIPAAGPDRHRWLREQHDPGGSPGDVVRRNRDRRLLLDDRRPRRRASLRHGGAEHDAERRRRGTRRPRHVHDRDHPLRGSVIDRPARLRAARSDRVRDAGRHGDRRHRRGPRTRRPLGPGARRQVLEGRGVPPPRPSCPWQAALLQRRENLAGGPFARFDGAVQVALEVD